MRIDKIQNGQNPEFYQLRKYTVRIKSVGLLTDLYALDINLLNTNKVSNCNALQTFCQQRAASQSEIF